tara:strand:- start:1981 stop:2535 length:555 start_codon:yes stop_codon:yes gene_type:complete
MEAQKLKSFSDLEEAWLQDENLELINGEIIRRPMSRFEHGNAQSDIITGLAPYRRTKGPGGWWIATEVSVKYSDTNCPVHDLAGWRKERIPTMPHGVIELAPDWVCEITSPGHEKKDLLTNLLLLQKYRVPFYWIISPEERSLIAYQLVNGKYSLIESVDHCGETVRIEPFSDVEFDLSYIFDA